MAILFELVVLLQWWIQNFPGGGGEKGRNSLLCQFFFLENLHGIGKNP